MNERLVKLGRYLAQQGRQASTWRGVIYVATAIFGYNLPPEKAAAVITIGMAFAGVVGMLLPDEMKKPTGSEPTPTDNTKGNP